MAEGASPRLVFIPVSGKYGMGEFARSLAIARGASDRWPAASIHFILSREAPYAADLPFPSTLLPSSPTFHSSQVIGLLGELCPDVVIFDNAGRTAQLRAAQRLHARIVFISARRRQRRKAFRLRWMRLIDEHWIAYPEFISGGLRFLERLKLKALRRPVVRYLDVILSKTDPAHRDPAHREPAHRGPVPRGALSRIPFAAGTYVLIVPGGGTGHPGAGAAIAAFRRAARSLAASGVPTVYVGPGEEVEEDSGVCALGPMPQSELAELMRAARLIIANGGSTLLQGIACATACVAAAIAGDQAERIRRCVAAGVAIHSAPDSDSMVRAAAVLLNDDAARRALAARAGALALADGVDVAIGALGGLMGLHV